eukprot:404305-Rhodomonas_salina.6
MSASGFVKDLRAFAQAASVDPRDVELLFCCRIIASFAQINAVNVLCEVLRNLELREGATGRARPKAEEVDWATVGVILDGENASASTVSAFWLELLSFVNFVDEPALTADMEQYILKVAAYCPGILLALCGIVASRHCRDVCARSQVRRCIHVGVLDTYTPIDAVRVAMCKSFPVGEFDWGSVCKTFLLMNLMQEDPAEAVLGLFRRPESGLQGVQDDAGVQVARHLVGFRNSAMEHEETLITLLTTYMSIDVRGVLALFDKTEREQKQLAVGVKSVFMQRLRPSLTAMAESQNARRVHYGGAAKGDVEDFAVFSHGVGGVEGAGGVEGGEGGEGGEGA